MPFSIIGVSYSLAAFPTLSRLISAGDRGKFLEQMITSARHIIFWSVPISVMFIVLRAQIVRTILGSGKFNWDDTRLFVVSLLAQNLVNLFVRSYYSQGKTRTPLLTNIFSATVIVLGSYYLVNLFQSNLFFKNFMESILKVSDLPGTAVLMLPLGFSIGSAINLIIHWIDFGRKFKGFSRPVLQTLFHSFGASVIMGFSTYDCLNLLDNVFDLNTLLGIFLQGFISGIVGIIIAILVLVLLKNQEIIEIWGILHKKIWKAAPLPPDAELN